MPQHLFYKVRPLSFPLALLPSFSINSSACIRVFFNRFDFTAALCAYWYIAIAIATVPFILIWIQQQQQSRRHCSLLQCIYRCLCFLSYLLCVKNRVLLPVWKSSFEYEETADRLIDLKMSVFFSICQEMVGPIQLQLFGTIRWDVPSFWSKSEMIPFHRRWVCLVFLSAILVFINALRKTWSLPHYHSMSSLVTNFFQILIIEFLFLLSFFLLTVWLTIWHKLSKKEYIHQ